MNGTKLDREHVRMLYERHGPALLAYAVSLIRDRTKSEDILHEVFMKLLERHVVVNGHALPYLYRAIRNTAFNYRRDHARECELPMNVLWLQSPPGQEETGLSIQAALENLPEEQREVVMLHIWGQLTFEETAEALDISPNTAASRYRYGVAKLKERLAPIKE